MRGHIVYLILFWVSVLGAQEIRIDSTYIPPKDKLQDFVRDNTHEEFLIYMAKKSAAFDLNGLFLIMRR